MTRAWFFPLALFAFALHTAAGSQPAVPQPAVPQPAVAVGATPEASLISTSSNSAGLVPNRLTSNSSSISKTVSIKTKDDLTLSANYWAPRSKKGALAPAALLLHDAGQSSADLDAIAVRMWKQGFAVLSVDLRGHGKSVGKKYSWKGCKPEAQDTLWAFSTRDVDAAASWVLSRKDVHRTNLNLVGHGAGCALAARHALEDENVRSIALLEPPTTCHGFDLAADLLALGGLPTLILAPKKKASATEKMVQEANATSAEHPYVTLMNIKSTAKVLEDKKTPSKVSSWVKGQAAPSSK